MSIRSKMGSADLAAALRREILSGGMIAGDKMPAERLMAEQHGVSRGTVREALTQLRAEDLVEIRPGSGAYVTYRKADPTSMPIEAARPLELMDARFALEPHICRLAVLSAGREDFEKLEALLARMEACVDNPERFADADSEFHAALSHSTGNSLLIWIVKEISSVRGFDEWKRMRNLTLDAPTILKYNEEHRAIVNAIRGREPERAAQLMKGHLETARLSLTRAAAT